MKKLILMMLLGFFLIPEHSFGQLDNSNKLFRKYKSKNSDLSLKLTLPGWLIKVGASIAVIAVDDPQEKEALRLLKKVKRMRLLIMENGTQLDDQYVASIFSRMRQNRYEDLIYARSQGVRINALIREDRGIIKNLFILIREDNEAVLVSMKTKLTLDQINKVLNMVDMQNGVYTI